MPSSLSVRQALRWPDRQAGQAWQGMIGSDDDAIAGLEALHILADLPDDAPKLVAQNGGIGNPAVKLAAVDVQIGAADARTAGFHQHLIRPDVRIGRVADAYVSIVIKDGCFHILLLGAPPPKEGACSLLGGRRAPLQGL